MSNGNKKEIKVTEFGTKNDSGKTGAKIDIYSRNPSEGPHDTIHIKVDTDNKTFEVVTKFDGQKEGPNSGGCYLTSACMKYFQEKFDDDCYQLRVLRWFRDNFVSIDDIEHYYMIAPIIVDAINKEKNSEMIYNYIFDNIVDYCVEQIEIGNYENAYNRYKSSILVLEEQFAKPVLTDNLIKVLKLRINN